MLQWIILATQVDQVPPFAGFLVEHGAKPAVGFGRDDRLVLGLGHGFAQPVGVKVAVCEKVAARQTVDQRRRAAQIVGLARKKAEVDQVAQSIRQCHGLAGHAAARTPDDLALSPPFAPCPWR